MAPDCSEPFPCSQSSSAGCVNGLLRVGPRVGLTVRADPPSAQTDASYKKLLSDRTLRINVLSQRNKLQSAQEARRSGPTPAAHSCDTAAPQPKR